VQERQARLPEERDARGLEEAADDGVVAVAERVEFREPDVVLDPVPVRRGIREVGKT
jgi:hypothetical protein